MTERGMIFNAEMVRAVLDGRKTQTRRAVKFPIRDKDFGCELSGNELVGEVFAGNYRNCPFGAVGDRLWVRETFATGLCTATTIAYCATHKPEDLDEGWYERIKWTPSIHMPRWASRITLEITGVRVERLNDISEDDAKAEGAPTECCVIGDKHFLGFRSLWRSIYGADSWQANPWVWVIEFKRVEVK
ncbi:MAG: morphogenetic protein [Pantoea sp. Morm]|uniref:morphogenetic protein n=1 Tax=Pantoea sp. Morm TaxID=2601250 RepID=UPI001DB2F7B7|nr:morphogenetic protein [Pantoea sp. Morm]